MIASKTTYKNSSKSINSILKLILKILLSLKLSILGILIGSVCAFLIFLSAYNVNNTSSIPNTSLVGVPEEFVPHFNEAAGIMGIPNWVLAGVAKQESNFNPNDAYGGAYGIMQFQKIDAGSGKDLWDYILKMGLGDIYKSLGFSYSSSSEMWDLYLKDPRVQIIAGAYEVKYYANYVLYKQKKVSSLQYDNAENMKLINWDADENDSDFKDTLRRIFACYNGGPGYGMSVSLDNAQFNYPNKVFGYAIGFRGTGLEGGIPLGDNATVEKAIATGSTLVGKSPYIWGGGRNPSDIANHRFDCSSFVHWCYASAGLNLGNYQSVVTDSLVKQGVAVKPSEMQRGDIIFFNTYKYNGHVAIYLGENKFLHDGSSRGVWINSLDESYWKKVFNGNVRRVIK